MEEYERYDMVVANFFLNVFHEDMMVKVLLPKATFETDDATDALAIAICHAHHRQSVTSRLAALGA